MSYYYDEYNEGRSKLKKIVFWAVIAVAAVLIVSAFIGISVRLDKLETYEEIPTSAYSRGVLNNTTGIFNADAEDYSGIYTKGYYTVEGLECKLAEDATIEYQINWYDEDKNFISVDEFSDDFTSADEIPSNAKFCRIEIMPTADDDGEVTALEVSKYAKMLLVRVNKQ